MVSGKRILLILLVLLGPGTIIYFISKTVDNRFIRLPYLGYEYTLDANGQIVDSTAYQVPDFELTSFKGEVINRDSIDGKIMILSTIQNECPDLKSCGMSLFHFNEIFFHKLVKNQDNYWNVRVMSILTDQNGMPTDSISPELREELVQYDTTGIWWFATGDVTPFYDFDYYGKQFIDQPASNKDGEIGTKAYTNSLILIDDQGHIRAVSGAKSDTDIRNFFDMVKLLKKEEFDANLAAEEAAELAE